VTPAERLHVCVLLGAGELLVRSATFEDPTWKALAEDFVKECDKFRDDAEPPRLPPCTCDRVVSHCVCCRSGNDNGHPIHTTQGDGSTIRSCNCDVGPKIW
jgi:hypothetical protein